MMLRRWYSKQLSIRSFVVLILVGVISSYAQMNGQNGFGENQFDSLLNELIRSARSNPSLQAYDSRIEASEAVVSGKKALDPPQIAIEFYQSPVRSFPNPFMDQMEYDYSIQQMIPFPGKTGAMARSEQKKTEMISADRQTLELSVIRKVQMIFYELYLNDRRTEINSETKQLLTDFVTIAAKQYEIGMGKQSDILRGQTELAVLENERLTLIQQRKSMVGMINALCGRPISTELPPIPAIDPKISSYNEDSLQNLAQRNRPELKSMEAEIGMNRAEQTAFRKEYLPDFMVKGMYKQMMESDDYWSLMIGATVPVAPWSIRKNRSAVVESEATARVIERERENMKNMIGSEINDAVAKIESAKSQLNLIRTTTIPKAQQALETARSEYRQGKQDFLMLIDIERMLTMAKLDYQMAVMAILESQSTLERAVGIGTKNATDHENRGDH